jgi:uncharacterized protein YbjT (DUF2867 family)
MSNLLVLGGTGFLGQELVAELVERSGGAGGRISVATRRLQHGRDLQLLPTVDIVQADVHDPRQLAELVRGRDAVINLVATLHGTPTMFEQVHVELPRKIGMACAEAGVRRIVHVSALGVGLDAPSHYLRSKAGGEAALHAIAQRASARLRSLAGAHAKALDLTLLRPSVMFGARDRLTNLFAALQAMLPVMPLAGANAQFQPVWVEDVASAIVECLHRPDTIDQIFECVGPHRLTLREIVRLAGEWSGHPRPIIALPAAIGRLQARLMELLPQPLMSRDNLDSMRVPSIATGQLPDLQALGITPSALEAVAPLYLAKAVSGRARLDALRAVAHRR